MRLLCQADEVPFQETCSGDGQGGASSSQAGAEPNSAAVEKILLDLTLQGVNLGSNCLESLSPLPSEAQAVLLRALLSRLKEGLEDQARIFYPLLCNSTSTFNQSCNDDKIFYSRPQDVKFQRGCQEINLSTANIWFSSAGVEFCIFGGHAAKWTATSSVTRQPRRRISIA